MRTCFRQCVIIVHSREYKYYGLLRSIYLGQFISFPIFLEETILFVVDRLYFLETLIYLKINYNASSMYVPQRIVSMVPT